MTPATSLIIIMCIL